MMGLLMLKDKVEEEPWLPMELLTHRLARLVLEAMTATPPDAGQYAYRMKEKVVRLIRQAPDL